MTVSTGHRSLAASSPPGVPMPHRSPVAAAPGGRLPGGTAVIRIRLLGRFAVEHDGQEIALGSFGGRLARRLLRLLALRRGTLVTKDLIADALWPDNPPADPAGNIEVLVSRIRRAMGDRALVRTGPGGYVLADGDRCWVDAEAFLSAVQAGQAALAARPAGALASFRAALGIWRGEPLPEDTHADWAQADRRRLWLAYLEALDGAATAALESTGAAAAGETASWARQAVAAEPLRESSVLLLVRALAAAGDRAGALAAFDRYRDRLAAETGLDPTPQARKIRQHVLAGQPARDQPASSRAARPATPHGSSPGRPDPFLGREEECAVITAAATGCGPRVVLVTGPSGIGKSMLLAEAARRADVPVLATQAFAPDQDEAWSLAGRLLRQASALLPDLPAAITEPEAAALREVIPGLARVPGTAVSALDEETRRAFALQGAVGLVAAAARPRCLIAADDLQWADPTSLTLLGLLLRRLDGVSLAAAYRTDGSTDFDPAEALGIPGNQITGLTLGPLPASLIRSLFSDQLLSEAIIRQVGRTPFTVTDVIAALARQRVITRDGDSKWRLRPGHDAAGATQIVTAGIGQAAGNRLAGLPSRWRDMLGLIALLGRPAPPALLAAASGNSQRTVLDTLEGLGSAGLACPGPRGWWIRHELIRQAVTAAIHPAETARFQALLAQALRQRDADPAETASHLAASGDNDQAAIAYAAAARRQLDRICDREALRLAETGLRLDPPDRTRAALLEVRGEARRRAGQLTAARADFTAALDSLDDPASRSRVLAQLAILDARTADAARGSELASLAIAEAGNQPAALGQALAAGAIIDLTGGNLTRARHQVRRAARLLDQAGDSRGSARLLYWRAMECFIDGRLHDAVRTARPPGPPGGHPRRGTAAVEPTRHPRPRPRPPQPGRRWPDGDRRDPRLGPRRPPPGCRGRVPVAPRRSLGHPRPGRRGDRVSGRIGSHRGPHRTCGMDRRRAPRPGYRLRGGGAVRPRRIRLSPRAAGRRRHPVVPRLGSRPTRRLPGLPGSAGRGRTARPGRLGRGNAAHPPRGPVGACRASRQPGRRPGVPGNRRDCPGPGAGRRLPGPGTAATRTRQPLTPGTRYAAGPDRA